MTQQINLFNPILLKQEKYLSARTMVQGAVLIVLACIALGGYVKYQSRQQAAQADALSAELKSVQAQLSQVSAAQASRPKNKELEEQIKDAEAEMKTLQQVSDVLKKGAVGESSGYSEYFRALARQASTGVWLTGLTIQGSSGDLTLQGRALQADLVPQYIGRLKTEPLMQGRSFSGLEIHNPDADPAKAGGKQHVAANYIEFTLSSTGGTAQ